MLLLIFCLGGILGSLLTLVVVLYWQSLVERIWLPPEKRHEAPKLVELDVLDADNPKVWLGCLFQFLFAELKDTEKLQKWFHEKLVIEVEELKEKLPSRFVKDLRLSKFGLGNQPPIISNVKLSGWKTNQAKDVVEEVAIRCDIRYAGEFYVALDVNLPIGQDAFVFIRLRQLVGNLEIKFSRQPFTHWSATFTDEPQMVIDAVTQVHGRAVPQLANIIVAKIKRSIRRRHVLPNFKIRFPPFFPKPMQQVASSNIPVPEAKKSEPSSSKPQALTVQMVAFSRLPPTTEPAAVLFFTVTCDSVPLPKQFAHVERYVVNITDPNDAIGILFLSTIYSVDAIDLLSRKFSLLQGYYISAVVADSPAQRAGIRPGGVLVAVDGVSLASTITGVDSLLRKAALNARGGTIRLDICNAESPPCQLLPFNDATSPAAGKDSRYGSTGSLNKDPLVKEVLSYDVDSAASTPTSPNATLRYRHRKNPSNCSMIVDLNKTTPSAMPLPLEEVASSTISRSSSDTNLAFHQDSGKKATEPYEIRPSSLFVGKPNGPVMSKDWSYLAEKPFQMVATLPPSPEDCVVLRYNDIGSTEDCDDPSEVVVGEVVWTKPRAYPGNTGMSMNLTDVFTLNLPVTAVSLAQSDETIRSVPKGSYLNVVAWIGVPNNESPINVINSKGTIGADPEERWWLKWNRLHAISYAVFDLSAVLDELTVPKSSANPSAYVRKSANLYPFASITPLIEVDNDSGSSLPLSTQRGFAPELCFGDVSVGFSMAGVNGQLKLHQNSQPPIVINRRTGGQDGGFVNLSRPDSRTGSSATLRGVPVKLALQRENCEHKLVVCVSSRSQPCTVCSKSLGILQRLSKSHAPLTCLSCGLLCHPRCAPNADKSKKPPSPLADVPPNESSDSLPIPTSNASTSSLATTSTESLAAQQGTNGVMSKWKTRAKKMVAVAREKEERIVAKAAPKITQKWRDLKSKTGRPFQQGIPTSQSSTSLPFDYGETVEVGEDVDSLLSFATSSANDNQSDAAVAEELIRAWAAKAAESPGAALEGSLAEALLSNGESDALLFQLKNLGKELFADLDSEERRTRLDSVISRLTEQLDQESELHAELKTQLKVARSEQAVAASSNNKQGLVRKVKQSGPNSGGSNSGDNSIANLATSYEAGLQRCDQRIRSLCLLIVHYSSGLDDCVSAPTRAAQNESSSSDAQLSEDSLPSNFAANSKNT